MSSELHASDSPDAEALRIHELVIEAGALVDWVDGGRGDLEVVGAALLYLRDELAALADDTHSADACQSACDMVSAIERTITRGSRRKPGHAAA
jgi:hypothetical protein